MVNKLKWEENKIQLKLTTTKKILSFFGWNLEFNLAPMIHSTDDGSL